MFHRYDPRRTEKNLNPFQLDSKKLKSDLEHYLKGQNRFEQLRRADVEMHGALHEEFDNQVRLKHKKLQKLAMDEFELLEHLKGMLGEETSSDKITILYGSETGNAEALAGVFATEFKRRGIRAKCLAMDDFEVDDLPAQSKVFCLVATCGQGEFPNNCRTFWKTLSDANLPKDFLEVGTDGKILIPDIEPVPL